MFSFPEYDDLSYNSPFNNDNLNFYNDINNYNNISNLIQIEEEEKMQNKFNKNSNNNNIKPNNGNFNLINDETNNTSLKDSKSPINLDLDNKRNLDTIIQDDINEKDKNDDFKSCYLQKKRKIYEKISYKPKKEKGKGRNKKVSNEMGEHNKFQDDNLMRKIKHIILDNVSSFIRQKLNEFYPKDNKKELPKINQSHIVKSKVEYNKEFLNKKIRDIFSEEISTKYSRYSPEHNKNLIQELLNEENEKIKGFFSAIFNLTFFDCLCHFRGSKNIKELNGLKMLEESIRQFEGEIHYELYQDYFKFFVDNYEKILDLIKPRDKKSKKI